MTRDRIGRLDTRLVLEASVDTPDGGGGSIGGWAAIGEIWASVAPVTGGERFVSDALRAQVSHRITIRYRADVTTALRLRDGTRVYRIGAVLGPGRRNRLDLLCSEEQA